MRRDAAGWRNLGPLTFKIEREDNHGDWSTTTIIKVVWITHWHTDIRFTRGWKDS